jgi:Na+-translocating ferredoxin:NAD+ oxidoreductase RnfA subunit
MLTVAKKFAQHVIPGVIRPIHIVWNQAIGFVFIVLAIVFGARVVRGKESPVWQVFGGLFVLLIAWYGISSFLKARKISKS